MFGIDFLHIDIKAIILAAGYIGIFSVIFAESGLFIGFFLPGDSLLFTVGLLASQGFFNIWILVPIATLCAILGDNFGYYFGKKVGPRLFNKEESIFFHRDHIKRTQKFFEMYGKKTIILARFIPVVRTFAPILAGVGGMEYRTFFTYNVVGGIIWAAGVLLAGYFLGQLFPDIEKYILPIIIAIVLTSFFPFVTEYLKKKKSKKIRH